MPDALLADLIDLRERAAALAVDTLIPLRDDEALVAGERRRRVAAASRAAGIFGLPQPVEVGGVAGSALARTVARDELGRHDVGHLPGLFGPTPGVLAGVGEPLRTDYLLPLLAGEKQGGFGFTEPAGAAHPTSARIEGADLVVNGQKSYVTGGADADFINALVEVEGTGPAMVLIDTATPGVELTRRFNSMDGSHHAAFTFSEVRIPASHVIGEPGQGMTRALGLVSAVRLAIAADSVGLCRYVIDQVTERLQTPGRGGRLPSDSERIRMRYGDLRIRTFAARATLYRAARLVDANEGGHGETANECMAAKVVATETVGEVVDQAIQLAGGEALVEGHPLESVYRRVRVLRLAEGPTDVLRTNIARGALDLDKGCL
ncbi:MAG: acyl-CoA/acyl-ACP dehydrogenase [Actinomycetia bacterium]|nr:acyl-CoA/acyl-ACP dehydrogenase [Actinomycetes bacterium]MCP3910269.1 acyl-CoA/acyl-ACP dehydrogenase [Actinomycetes bacterium]MCP4084964.1 acyl-CoA/acyl-ACP dehydrogenase [Actinomycetes bacterium]